MDVLYGLCLGAFPASIIAIVAFLYLGMDIKIMGIWSILTGLGLLIIKT